MKIDTCSGQAISPINSRPILFNLFLVIWLLEISTVSKPKDFRFKILALPISERSHVVAVTNTGFNPSSFALRAW